MSDLAETDVPETDAPAAEVPPLDDGPAPVWFTTTPAQMARVVSSVYQEMLSTYGLPPTRAGLIQVFAETQAAAKLDGQDQQPADAALRVALDVVADAYTNAMQVHGMFAWAIDAIEDRVRSDVNETIEEHMKVRAEMAAHLPEPPADDDAADEEEPAGEGPSGG